MVNRVLADLVVRGLAGRTIATAESCTAGRVAAALACVDDASAFLRGGLVAYQECVKREHLGVTAKTVFSLSAAEQMAAGAAHMLGSDVAAGVTGVAGTEAVDGVAPGTVFIATSVDGVVTAREHRFDGTPERVCEQAAEQTLRDLVAVLSTSKA